MEPAKPPLPTPRYLPFQPDIGIHTSNSILESLEGRMMAWTRQNAGSLANSAEARAVDGMGGEKSPAAMICTWLMVVPGSCSCAMLSHVAADSAALRTATVISSRVARWMINVVLSSIVYFSMRSLICLFCFLAAGFVWEGAAGAQTITVRFPASRSDKPLDGRLLVLLSNDPKEEPRMQIDDTPKSQMIFGVTVDAWKPGDPLMIGDNAQGYPRASLKDVPAGDYTIQAVLNVYETFHRSDGKTVKLAPDRGEGQHWNLAPGNLLSKPRLAPIGPGAPPIAVSLTEVIPPIEPERDTKYIRHIRIQSKLLTGFWGRPMYLSAVVLVPEGYDSHLDAHYPLIVFHDHFVTAFSDFRETPPDPNLKPDYSERFHLAGYNRIQQEEAYKNYQAWIAPGTP